jgi:hypothetical protein
MSKTCADCLYLEIPYSEEPCNKCSANATAKSDIYYYVNAKNFDINADNRKCCGNCKFFVNECEDGKGYCTKHEGLMSRRTLCTGWENKEGDDNNMTKVELHEAICEKLNKIYEQKNTDYNDSFAKARKEVPNYTYGKLYDKWERYKQLQKNEAMVKSETIEDTMLDMANYLIMELLERGLENENK